MSNTEPSLKRSARWHSPAIWGIIVAILAVGAAILFLAPWGGGDDVSRQMDTAAPGVAEGTAATAVEPAATDGPVTATQPAN